MFLRFEKITLMMSPGITLMMSSGLSSVSLKKSCDAGCERGGHVGDRESNGKMLLLLTCIMVNVGLNT